ncbi:hypothetical protein [Paenibacillus faecalis]|uniref:hypothetical protein n=1 Tax=Paenibacillus faecalis TaxID=2079532 RepID=UPI000D0F44E5|nr:hypothetical protein [Paenibacillus faecalis]
MVENYNFQPGVVTYNPYNLNPDDLSDLKWLNEDMVQVEYPNGYLLDVGWYGKAFTLNGVFMICIVKDYKWDNPVFIQKYRSVTELYEGMQRIIERINQLINQ